MKTYNLSTLFHFTKTKENLFAILKNEFKPTFCLEKIHYGHSVWEYAIPMVCFCDIRLSQINDHIKTYGNYGIGMSKEWAERQGLNPVIYLNRNSRLSNNLSAIKLSLSELLRTPDNDKVGTYLGFLYVLRYLKNYKGKFPKDEDRKADVIFYNEREWRYVPTTDVLSKVDYLDRDKREHYNSQLPILSFGPNDIKYIIVNDDSEIKETIDAVREMKPKSPPSVVDILTSRIITSEQIKNDF
jgi:hypothetical protein